MAPLLEARDLRKVFPGGGLFGKSRVVALENFSMAAVAPLPSFTAVAGESGSGKTTLARLLLGLLEPTSGEVLHKGKNIRGITGGERKDFRRDVQAIFQDPFGVYNPFYKIDHILTTPVYKFRLAGTKSEARGLIEEALRAVGLRPEETLGRYPHQLSGGQRQRITIARALLLKPRLIIADEPVSMVDASLRATILGNLRELHRGFGISFLYITHDLATAYQVAENIIILYRGIVVEAGDIEAVVHDPKHPCTRELIGSIPVADPKRRLPAATVSKRGGGNQTAGVVQGCRYRPRCPHAMPCCAERRPPLFRLGKRRAAACYLYEDCSTLANQDLTAVLGNNDNPQSS